MVQKVRECLALNFACADTVVEGDVVEITGDLTIAVPTGAGSIKVVGTVARKRGYLLSSGGGTGGTPDECTVETRFRERRDDRVSGAAVAVGPFVFDANGKVINYSSASHDPAAIRGLAITHTTGADAALQTLEY